MSDDELPHADVDFLEFHCFRWSSLNGYILA